MRLTIFHPMTSITVEVKSFNHYGDAFFTFHADLTEDLVDYLSKAELIYRQPSEDCYQLPRTVEFKLE